MVLDLYSSIAWDVYYIYIYTYLRAYIRIHMNVYYIYRYIFFSVACFNYLVLNSWCLYNGPKNQVSNAA